MINQHIHYTSRLSSRAVVAGTLAAFSLNFLFMLLAGAFGLFPTNLAEMSLWGASLWGWATVSWIASIYIASYVATMSSRSITKRDGALHGFVVWSTTTFLSAFYLDIISSGTFLETLTMGMLWAFFFGSALALGGAILGGVQGTFGESRAQFVEEKEIEQKESKLKTAG